MEVLSSNLRNIGNSANHTIAVVNKANTELLLDNLLANSTEAIIQRQVHHKKDNGKCIYRVVACILGESS
ncbi:hypothetical protein AX774_g6738 [Zancudomyces culisetae]|uniref:Uncharacterized protein n=1 Tax=Zancudomyces culisetae TaxID=1213189 RepID=A0A1R1PFV6_ZANCU|nr:hypothetical protein AX774_g6738 [Zancudomyces culisetae]|eukprot:OMH79837.1 hypothetical protein AX774_g6738 [Zancudomyces culisetae]